VEDIYEEIIMHVRKYYEKYGNVNENNIKTAEDHIRNQIELAYNKDMKILKDKNEELVAKNKLMNTHIKKVIKKANSTYTHFMKIKASKITTECKKVIDDLNKMYLADVADNVTFQKIKNESIYEELVDFPIKYTGNSKHQVTKVEFINICKIYNINDSIVKDTINKLDTDPFVKSKSIIYGIVNCDFIKDFDTEEHKNIEEDTSEDAQDDFNVNLIHKEEEASIDILTEEDNLEVADGSL
jgi:hypothetical protein